MAASSAYQGASKPKGIFWGSFKISFGFQLLISVALLVGAREIGAFLLQQNQQYVPGALQAMTSNVVMVAVIQFWLTLVIVVAGVLRGMSDVARPLVLVLFNYVGLGVCGSLALLLLTDLQEFSVWLALAASLAVSLVMLLRRTSKRLKQDDSNN